MSDESLNSQLIIEMIGDMISGVDANSKREADKLCDDITLLRGELNDTRKDMMLMRTEMNTLRVDMSDMRGKLENDMLIADKNQELEIKLIQQEGKITGDRKAQVVGVIVTGLSILGALAAKILGIL